MPSDAHRRASLRAPAGPQPRGFGLLAALALTRLMDGLMFGVSATDPAIYLLLTSVMVAIAGLALYLPARTASRVDPLEALRGD